jgi:hypothetical protein
MELALLSPPWRRRREIGNVAEIIRFTNAAQRHPPLLTAQ